MAGDHLRSGHYQFYLRQDPESQPKRSDVAPFGNQILTFNDERPDMLQVVKGKPGTQPDLLIVRQYASCNGSLVAVLTTTPDGTDLVHLRFQTPERIRDRLQVGLLTVLGSNLLETRSYDNAKGEWTIATWEVQVPQGLLVAVQITSQ